MTTEKNIESPRLSESIAESPDRVLDAVRKRLNLKSDAALSRALGVRPPVISKIRHRRLTIGPLILLRMLEATGLHIRDLLCLSQGAQPRRRSARHEAS